MACWGWVFRSSQTRRNHGSCTGLWAQRDDAGGRILNLAYYPVRNAVDLPAMDVGCGGIVGAAGNPSGGVLAVRVPPRRPRVVRDLPVGGRVQVVWAKRRWLCAEMVRRRGTFHGSTVSVPGRAT